MSRPMIAFTKFGLLLGVGAVGALHLATASLPSNPKHQQITQVPLGFHGLRILDARLCVTSLDYAYPGKVDMAVSSMGYRLLVESSGEEHRCGLR